MNKNARPMKRSKVMTQQSNPIVSPNFMDINLL